MKIIVVDDDKISLLGTSLELKKIPFVANIVTFASPIEALEYLEENTADVALLDVVMAVMDGVTLARHIIALYPTISIIFLTGYSQYAVQALKIHASGYILKPATVDDLKSELLYAKEFSDFKTPTHEMRVHTFGNFEVFVDNVPLKFKYSKTKELFAYLIDRRGAFCTIGELIGVLWEEKEATTALNSQLRNLITDLTTTLRQIDLDNILVKRRGVISIIPKKINCDYYELLRSERKAVAAYSGEYMANYSWAEFTAAYLTNKVQVLLENTDFTELYEVGSLK